MRKLKLSTAAVEEACKGLNEHQNVSTSTTRYFKDNIVKDKINNIMGVRAQILEDIENIVTIIENKSNNDEHNIASDVKELSTHKWIKYKKLVSQEINSLWIALRDRREEKICHLIKKYPQVTNRQKRRSKNIVKAANDTKNVQANDKTDTIESLIDIENIKAKILNEYKDKI